jgi:LysM repeat protein
MENKMARITSRLHGRQGGRTLNILYGISALFIVAGVVSFIYGRPFGTNEEDAHLDFPNVNVESNNKSSKNVGPEITRKRIEEPNLAKIIPQATSEANPKVTELIGEAVALINGSPARIIEARDRLNEMLSMPMNNVQRAAIKEKLTELANKWLFSRTVFAKDRFCSNYPVTSGEKLMAIGKQHNVPWEILQEVNKISRPELVKAGTMIKVINGPFHARIYRSTFTMDLYLQHVFVRSFRVGLGQEGRETPTGLWRVKEGGKLIKPPWSHPDTGKLLNYGDPGYALGSRWIALEGITGNAKNRSGFGIHGTVEPETIGTKSSRGCIRLHNGDVIKVYNLLVPGYSQVEIVD